MDAWNPDTFDAELRHVLWDHSELIVNYAREDHRLMDEYINSDRYEMLEPNPFGAEHLRLREHVIAPLLNDRRIRVWHYTRLTDDEVISVKERLQSSTLTLLKERLDALVRQGHLIDAEATTIHRHSPFHEQDNARSNRFWTVSVPMHCTRSGVVPLLSSWGGESAYFWLRDEQVAAKLKNIGRPRILEIETSLDESLNAFTVAETVLQAWAKTHGAPNEISGHDLSISRCIDTARILHVHTEGDETYERIGKTYPESCDLLVDD